MSNPPPPSSSGPAASAAPAASPVASTSVDANRTNNDSTMQAAASAATASASVTAEASASNTDDSLPPSDAAAAAAATTTTTSNTTSAMGDATMAQLLSTIETLTSVFGFDVEVANQAVEAVGTDVTVCYNYILDAGMGKDQGGPIYPISTCPHIQDHVKLTPSQLPHDPQLLPCTFHQAAATNTGTTPTSTGGAKSDTNEDGSCPMGENWLCLECGVVRCSRYVNGHALSHWEDSKTDSDPDGHCVAVSFADLSAWCHVCSAYVKNTTLLDPLVRRLEELKFPNENTTNRTIEGERETKRSRSNLAGEDPQHEENDTDMESTVDPSSNARGYPINLDTSDEEEEIDYVFGESIPASMEELAEFITSDKCQNIVVLAGAGMSVRSGIPDFRSANGLYATMNPDLLTADPAEREVIRMDPSAALEQGLFLRNPLPCLELNRSFLLGTREQRWKATLAHRFVEMLHSKTNKLIRLYTQNIDGLEDQCTALPREKVINVHGSMDRAACATCFQEADFDTFCDQVERQIKDLSGEDANAPNDSTPIVCDFCGFNTMKPAIVLFKSSLPKRFFELLPGDVADVDLLIVMGTSLQVAPANGLIWLVPRSALRLVINRDPVGHHLGMQYGMDAPRDYFAQGDIDPTCLDLMTHLGWLDDLEPLLAENKLPDSSAELLRERLQQVAATTTSSSVTDAGSNCE